MKLIIDIPEEIKAVIDKNGTNEIVAETLWQAVKNGTPIPDNATNSDVMLTTFPNETDLHTFARHNKVAWWNAPYQKGGK